MKNTYIIILFISIFNNILLRAQCSPTLYLPFNGNAKDSSGYNNHGTVNGATLTVDRFNNPNRAYYFDGYNDDITIIDDSTNDLTKTYTIMAWIKSDNIFGSFKDNHVCIVDKWGNAGNKLAAYNMSIHTNGELEGFTHTGSSGTYKWSNSQIKKQEWTHIAVTRSSDDSVRLYINGILDKTYYAVLPQNSGFPLKIGMQSDPSITSAYPNSYRFKGSIDEVKLFKCALKPKDFGLVLSELKITSIIKNNVSSNGLSNGNFSVYVTGGYAPYQYSINSLNYQDTNFFNNLKAGKYKIYIKDYNGSMVDSFLNISEPSNLEKINSSQIEIYPNPNNGTFKIDMYSTNNFEVILYDNNGKIVYNEKNKNIIETKLSNGIYQLMFIDKSSSKVYFKKIIINY